MSITHISTHARYRSHIGRDFVISGGTRSEASFERQQSRKMRDLEWERETTKGKALAGFLGGVLLVVLTVWFFWQQPSGEPLTKSVRLEEGRR